MLCEIAGAGNGLGGTLALAGGGCNNNWNMWAVGSRLQWDVTKSFYLGIEALYDDMHSATTGCANIGSAAAGACPGDVAGGETYAFGGATATASNANAWIFTIRAHRELPALMV